MSAPVHGRIDRDGRLIEADPPLARLQERAGGTPGGIVAVPQIATLARLVRRLGIVVSRGVVAADGDEDLDLWVRAQPEEDGVRLAIASWSARPAAPAFAAAPIEREQDFLRSMADWLWQTDEALRLTGLSPALIAAVGDFSALGEPLTRLFSLETEADGALPILEALALQRRFDGQVAELKRSGGLRVRLAGAPVMEGGRFAGYRGAALPIDEEAEATPVLVESSGGAFGQRLDTALRGPLDRIIASADSIRAQGEGPLRRDYAGYASDIASAGRHLLALIDDLVDLQAIERPDFTTTDEAIDLADIARRAAGLLGVRAVDGEVGLDRPAEDESVPAIGDFRRALQVLVNLVGNAVRYSPQGGAVWIRCEQDGDRAIVIVADQGKGIAAEDQERIFDKFGRVDPNEPGGTGLGLYIARRLARAMGGDVTVDSAPGQGARFVFTLRAE